MSIYKGKEGRKTKKIDFSNNEANYQIKLQQEKIEELRREIKKTLTKLKRYGKNDSIEKLEKKYNPITPADYEAILNLILPVLAKEKKIAQRRKDLFFIHSGMKKDPEFRGCFSDNIEYD